MSFPTPLDIARGGARGWESFIKYGHNGGVGTSYVAINTENSLYLPQPSAAATLHAVSTSADDSAAGSGAQTVLLRGLDATGYEISEILTMNGTGITASTGAAFWRLQFADVLTSGTYGTHTTGSHAGTITISDGVDTWAVIDSNGYPHSRWQSSWYTVPMGYSAVVASYTISVESNKLADFKVLGRRNSLDDAEPYSPMSELIEITGTSDTHHTLFSMPFGPLPELYDIGFIGRLQSGSGGQFSVSYEIAQWRVG